MQGSGQKGTFGVEFGRPSTPPHAPPTTPGPHRGRTAGTQKTIKKSGDSIFCSIFAVPFEQNGSLKYCGNSSVGRARPCQGRGREFESRFPLQTPRSNAGRFCLGAMGSGVCGALVHNPLIITHLQNTHPQTSRKNQGSADVPFATH